MNDARIQSANCWVEIDKSAIKRNIVELKRNLNPGQLFMAVVKANAYGHGMVEVANVALKSGADWLGVFSAGEGITLRESGVDAPILVFGPVNKAQMPSAVESDLRLTVSSLEATSDVAELISLGARVHLKIETGTNRQGLTRDEVVFACKTLKKSGAIVEGAYTHFADIEDTTDHTFAKAQQERFEEIIEILDQNGYPIPIAHTACSAAAILFPSTHLGMVRVGISLYGLWPSKETLVSAASLGRNALDLRPVMTWKTRIAQIKSPGDKEFIGYGRTYRTTRPSRIAVLPVGYADGYDRKLSNSAHVLVRGARAPLRGRVCMNLTMVDVTDIPDASPGDEVVLMGSQGDERVSAEDLAEQAQTINYEIVTRAAPGAPRIII